MNARTLLGVIVVAAVVWGVVGSGSVPAAAQAQLPGNIAYDRVVAPLDVALGEKVHVTIELSYDNVRTSRGTDVIFVVDRTPTMFDTSISRPTPMDVTKEALQFFVNSMDVAKSEAGLITYAGTHSIGRNLTDDQDAMLQAIRNIRMDQENDVRGLVGAFRTATQKLDNDGTPGNEKVVMIVVAGPDQGQELVNMPTVTQAARNAGVKVVFLMFQIPGKINAAYGHYVAASSDCSWGYCVNWSGMTSPKYAWGVGVEGNSDIRTVTRNLVEHFLFMPSLGRLLVNEGFDPVNVHLLPNTVAPPPARVVGPPYYDVQWEFDNLTRGSVTIDYDAEPVYPDDTYPVTSVSQLILELSDGQRLPPIDLPNPMLTVRSAVPTTPATPTETATPTEAPPSETPATATPTASATPTEGPEGAIFLPVARNDA